jgi:hypothetical protein
MKKKWTLLKTGPVLYFVICSLALTGAFQNCAKKESFSASISAMKSKVESEELEAVRKRKGRKGRATTEISPYFNKRKDMLEENNLNKRKFSKSKAQRKLALIFVGGGQDEGGKNTFSQRVALGMVAYTGLRQMGYSKNDILILTGDNINLNRSDVKYVAVNDVNQLADEFSKFVGGKNFDSLLLYMIARSDEERIFINDNKSMQFKDLASGLGNLSEHGAYFQNRKLIFVLESDYGVNILKTHELKKNNFYVMATELKDASKQNIISDPYKSFSYQFWTRLSQNRTLGIAAWDAFARTYAVQHSNLGLSLNANPNFDNADLKVIRNYCLSYYKCY